MAEEGRRGSGWDGLDVNGLWKLGARKGNMLGEPGSRSVRGLARWRMLDLREIWLDRVVEVDPRRLRYWKGRFRRSYHPVNMERCSMNIPAWTPASLFWEHKLDNMDFSGTLGTDAYCHYA
jgi:hypothetical protein